MRISYETLSPQVKRGIKRKAYSLEDLEQIQKNIIGLRQLRLKGFKLASIILVTMFVLMSVMGAIGSTRVNGLDVKLLVWSATFEVLLLGSILVFIKMLSVDLVRNQFIGLIKRNYPEYAGIFSKDSFK